MLPHRHQYRHLLFSLCERRLLYKVKTIDVVQQSINYLKNPSEEAAEHLKNLSESLAPEEKPEVGTGLTSAIEGLPEVDKKEIERSLAREDVKKRFELLGVELDALRDAVEAKKEAPPTETTKKYETQPKTFWEEPLKQTWEKTKEVTNVVKKHVDPRTWPWGKVAIGAGVAALAVGTVAFFRWMFSKGKQAKDKVVEKTQKGVSWMKWGLLAAGAGIAGVVGWHYARVQLQRWMEPIAVAHKKAQEAKETADALAQAAKEKTDEVVQKGKDVIEDVKEKKDAFVEHAKEKGDQIWEKMQEAKKRFTGEGTTTKPVLSVASEEAALFGFEKYLRTDKVGAIYDLLKGIDDKGAAKTICDLYNEKDNTVDMKQLRVLIDLSQYDGTREEEMYTRAAEGIVGFCGKYREEVRKAYDEQKKEGDTDFDDLTFKEYVGYLANRFRLAFNAASKGGEINPEELRKDLTAYTKEAGLTIQSQFEGGVKLPEELREHNIQVWELGEYVAKRGIASNNLRTFRGRGATKELDFLATQEEEAKRALSAAEMELAAIDERLADRVKFDELRLAEQEALAESLMKVQERVREQQAKMRQVYVGRAFVEICKHGIPSGKRLAPLFHKKLPNKVWDLENPEANYKEIDEIVLEFKLIDITQLVGYDMLLRSPDAPSKVSGLVPLQMMIAHMIDKKDKGVFGRRLLKVRSKEMWTEMVREMMFDKDFQNDMLTTFGIGVIGVGVSAHLIGNAVGTDAAKTGAHWLGGKLLDGIEWLWAARQSSRWANPLTESEDDRVSQWLPGASPLDIAIGYGGYKVLDFTTWIPRKIYNYFATRTDIVSMYGRLTGLEEAHFWGAPGKWLMQKNPFVMSVTHQNAAGELFQNMMWNCRQADPANRKVVFLLQDWIKRGKANPDLLESMFTSKVRIKLREVQALLVDTSDMSPSTIAKLKDKENAFKQAIKHAEGMLSKDADTALQRACMQRYARPLVKRFSIWGFQAAEVNPFGTLKQMEKAKTIANDALRVDRYKELIAKGHKVGLMWESGARFRDLVQAVGGDYDELLKGGIHCHELFEVVDPANYNQVVAAYRALKPAAQAKEMSHLVLHHSFADLRSAAMGFDLKEVVSGIRILDPDLLPHFAGDLIKAGVPVNDLLELGLKPHQLIAAAQIIHLDDPAKIASLTAHINTTHQAIRAEAQMAKVAVPNETAETFRLLQADWDDLLKGTGLAIDDVEDFLRAAGYTAEELAIIRQSGGARKLLVGAMQADIKAYGTINAMSPETAKVLRWARLARNARIGMNATGVGGDVFMIFVAAMDYMENGHNLEQAKQTKNKALQEVYREAQVFNVAEGGAGLGGLVVYGYAVCTTWAAEGALAALGTTAGPLLILTLPVVIGAGYMYRGAQSVREKWLREEEDWARAMQPGQLLQQLNENAPGKRGFWDGYGKGTLVEQMARNPRSTVAITVGGPLFASTMYKAADMLGLEDSPEWEEEGEKTIENANTRARQHITHAYLIQTTRMAREEGESDEAFHQKIRKSVESQMLYMASVTDGEYTYQNNGINFQKARIHADLLERSLRLKKDGKSEMIHWVNPDTGKADALDLATYADLPMHSRNPKKTTQREVVRGYYQAIHDKQLFDLNVRCHVQGMTAQQKEIYAQKLILMECEYAMHELEANISATNFTGWFSEEEGANVARVIAYRRFRSAVRVQARKLVEESEGKILTTDDFGRAIAAARAALNIEAADLEKVGREEDIESQGYLRDREKIASMLTLHYALNDADRYQVDLTETVGGSADDAVDIEQFCSQSDGVIKVDGKFLWVKNAKGYKLRPIVNGELVGSTNDLSLISIESNNPVRIARRTYTVYRPGENYVIKNKPVMGSAPVTVERDSSQLEMQTEKAINTYRRREGRAIIREAGGLDLGDNVYSLRRGYIFNRPVMFWFDEAIGEWKAKVGDWNGSEAHNKQIAMSDGQLLHNYQIKGWTWGVQKNNNLVRKLHAVNRSRHTEQSRGDDNSDAASRSAPQSTAA